MTIDIEEHAAQLIAWLGDIPTREKFCVLRLAHEQTEDALRIERAAIDDALRSEAPKAPRKQRADKGKPRAPKVAP